MCMASLIEYPKYMKIDVEKVQLKDGDNVTIGIILDLELGLDVNLARMDRN